MSNVASKQERLYINTEMIITVPVPHITSFRVHALHSTANTYSDVSVV